MARSPKSVPTHYQILQVHPGAPLDLITAAYWRLVSHAQAGPADKASEVAVYHLTRSYQVLADHNARAEYDLSLGISSDDLVPKVPARRKSSWMSSFWSAQPETRPAGDLGLDYYELLRLDPLANQAIVKEAHTTVRHYYLRLAEQGRVAPELVLLLDEAHEVISDPARRRLYDQKRKQSAAAQTAPRPQAGNGTASPTESAGDPPLVAGGSPARVRKATRAARPVDVSSEPGGENGRRSPVGAVPDEAPGPNVVKALASGSAAALGRSGKGSLSLAKRASQMLRDALLDVQAQTSDGLSLQEEEALLERLSQMPETELLPESESLVAQSGPLARLTLIDGPGLGREFAVEGVPFTLGEDVACEVALPGLAAQQARLLHRDGHFVLYSLSDEPRTRVHGNSVTWAVLQDGDSFEIGPYTLRFDCASVAATQA